MYRTASVVLALLATLVFTNLARAQQPVSIFQCTDVAGSSPPRRSCVEVNADSPLNVHLSNAGGTTTDGSTTITLGGTAQNLFGSTIPTNGWTIINPDPSEDCWASDTTTAAANNTGSIRLAANGGGYETPPGRTPKAAVSVVCATTGHKLTASRW